MKKPINYIDFHCHPGLKTFLSANVESARTDCWQNIDVSGCLELFDTLLGKIFESQSSLTQIKNGGVSIALVGLYAYEKAMIKGKIIYDGLSLLVFSSLLEWLEIQGINYELLKRISSPGSNYFKVFDEVQTHLLNSEKINCGYKLLNKMSEYDPEQLNVILTIEGGHNLYDEIVEDNDNNNKVLQNLKKLKTSENRYLFLGLAHLEHIPMCTHAYGMKIIEDDMFKPIGDGISDLGKEVIKKALEEPNRILIDIKHMSLRSRLQYYDMLDPDKIIDPPAPIIMSHAGVTGVSYNEMPIYEYEQEDDWVKVQYYKPDGLMGTKFNPWSINLYDEDIIKIIKSEGMIGINLDERILGTKQQTSKQLTEYFSKDEFVYYKPAINHNLNKYQKLQKKTVKEFDEYEELAIIKHLNKYKTLDKIPQNELNNYEREIIQNPDKYKALLNLYKELQNMPVNVVKMLLTSHKDLLHICNNILHIVKIGKEKAWEHICIGSDFDGLVNAAECCINTEKYEKLHRNLLTWLPKMARSDPKTNYYINNIELRVEGIMFKNAYEFLQKNFQ